MPRQLSTATATALRCRCVLFTRRTRTNNGNGVGAVSVSRFRSLTPTTATKSPTSSNTNDVRGGVEPSVTRAYPFSNIISLQSQQPSLALALALNAPPRRCTPSYSLRGFTSHRPFCSSSAPASASARGASSSASSERISYNKAIASILSSKKFLSIQKALETQGIWNKETFSSFRSWMLMKDSIVDPDETSRRWHGMKNTWSQNQDTKDSNRSLFISELRMQREVFATAITGNASSSATRNNKSLDDDDNNTNKKFPQSFFSVSQQVFRQLAEQCENKSQPFIIFFAWEKIKESGMLLNASTLNALLNVASKMMIMSGGSGGSGSGSRGGIFEVALNHQSVLALEEIVMYHDVLCGPTDKGESLVAEATVKTFKNTAKYQRNSREMTYLQIYSLVLKHHCKTENVNVGAALLVFRRMQALSGVVLEPWVYIQVLSTIAENGYFRDGSQPITDGAIETGNTHASGSELFDELMSTMMGEVTEITPECAMQLHNALSLGFRDSQVQVKAVSKEEPSMRKLLSRTIPAKHNGLVACRVSLDPFTWVCPVTETQQRISSLSPSKKKSLYDDLFQSVKDHKSSKMYKDLNRFSDWLESRKGQPFTAIVDGANVGAILPVVRALEQRGEYPLVILPTKHAQERKDLISLERCGQLYTAKDHDDIYCILASVSDQKTSCNGSSIYVESSTTISSRWPGARPMLITNDILRDHTLLLNNPLLGREWYNCHVVKFENHVTVTKDGWNKKTPYFYQRGIQGNTCPMGGKAWHFPVAGWVPHERFVVRIPTCTT